jgi:hypothetical protein
MKTLHMKQLILISSLLFYFHSALAQDKKIQADRPGETQTPATTQKGFVQAEIGFEKEQQNKDDYSVMHPQLQLKYGLSDRFEIRAELTAETNKQYSSNQFQHGLRPVELGFKAKLLEEKGALPETSFYTQVGIPSFASKDHQTTHAVPHLRLLFQNKLSEKVHLEYNVGADWDGDETSPHWLYTIAPEIEIGEKWEAFVEAFGHVQKGMAAQHQVDGGLSFYPTNNMKLDVYAGKGISKEAPEYFISAGVSFRLK